jgi:hypothetical protein
MAVLGPGGGNSKWTWKRESMSWRTAFFQQARSDVAIMDYLNEGTVPYAHQLHYLQMFSEKLSRALLAAPESAEPPEPTHAALVRMLRALKTRPEIARQLGYRDRQSYRSYIDSLLPFAQEVQALAPIFAGFTRPNPEYPWKVIGTREPIAPCDYEFSEFNPKRPQMAKLVGLLRDLTRIHL